MNKIRTVIIEDEKEDTDLLENLLGVFDFVEIIDTAEDVKSGIEVIERHKPELIFLDIRLYGKISFEILDVIYSLNIKPKVIFTTAFDEYMHKAFKYSAFDYLLKPIDRKELKDTLMRYVESKNKYDFVKSYDKFRKMVFNTAEGFEIINPDEIVYVSTVKNQSYSELFMSDGSKITITKNIGEVEKILPEDYFYKIHRSYILNLNYVKKVNRIKQKCYLSAENISYEIPISREKSKLLREKIRLMN